MSDMQDITEAAYTDVAVKVSPTDLADLVAHWNSDAQGAWLVEFCKELVRMAPGAWRMQCSWIRVCYENDPDTARAVSEVLQELMPYDE